MNFPSIDIQGSILSNDLLSKIRSEQATFQQGKDFNPDLTNAKLKDEISLAWQEAKGQWTIYKSKLTRLKDGDTGTTETRNFWISPLLTNLGYNLIFNRNSEELNGKSFPIGYRDSSLDNFPIYVGGYHESLDKRPENKQLRVSPHAMVQEYLNYSEHLYGMVTNGRQLRLLRDASRITRLSYVEFNLEKIMEEDLYSDFVILYRVLHASRMPKRIDGGAESIMEKYHQEGLEAGSTIRNKLGEAVKGAIKNLANGFINHPNNGALREAVAAGNINVDEYYRHQLRIIYRLLFLFVIEERNLVYADSKTPETKRFNHIYFNHYSLLRLRKLAKKLLPPEANRHYDLWQSLVSTFSIFEKKEIGEKIGIMSLQGDLFGYHAIRNNQYDLHECYLSNAVLLNIIKSLSYFENNNGVLIAVNYGGLDVEEFGSVYEGLLELKLEFNKIEGTDNYSVNWQKQAGGREFQSHYTPEELVQPLIKHSLEYLIEDILLLYAQKKVNKENTIKALLKLKVCDVACGSGHILLSAARRIALAVARVLTDEDQPNPLSIRKAMKDVVKNCIYGVDKNPLAVELCKIALWLEAYNPGEPLNFLDHHIKCGDAIVGLAHRSELENGIATEAFKALTNEEKESKILSNDARIFEITLASSLAKRNKQERAEREDNATQVKANLEISTKNSVQETLAEYTNFNQLPETTPDEIERKAKAYRKFIDGKGFTFLKAMADTQVAQFFIPKTLENKDKILTDSEYRQILSGNLGWQGQKTSYATAVALEHRFFHWFIEFPEVFNEGGFDCILGNPPYLHNQKLSGFFGHDYLNCVQNSIEIDGSCDLVTYFVKRIFKIITVKSFFSIITTNSVCQGRTREQGLEVILKNGGNLNFVRRSIKWSGVADLYVSCFTLSKGNWTIKKFLDNQEVLNISSYFDDTNDLISPYQLNSNLEKMFQGSIYLGEGFLINDEEKKEIISHDSKNSEVIFGLLSGRDVNESFIQKPSSNIINFFDWSEEKAKEYEKPYLRLKELVKPERQRDGNLMGREKWWQYYRRGVDLYNSIKVLTKEKKCFITIFTSKYLNFSVAPTDLIFTNGINVFASDKYYMLSCLQSNLHQEWARKYGSTLKNDLRYTPTKCFEPFPFPQSLEKECEVELEKIGKELLAFRENLMIKIRLGLTKTYNLFHSENLKIDKIFEESKQDLETCKEIFDDIINLRELHKQIDETVLKAYGWEDLDLLHGFHEVDYLPEKDRVRFTIHPNARKEVLKRLLALNHKLYEEEIEKGLHKDEDVRKFYEQKGTEIPAEVLLVMGTKKPKATQKPKKNKPNNGDTDQQLEMGL